MGKLSSTKIFAIMIAITFSLPGVVKAQTVTLITVLSSRHTGQYHYQDYVIDSKDSIGFVILPKKSMNQGINDTVTVSIYNSNYSITRDDMDKILILSPRDSIAFQVIKKVAYQTKDAQKVGKKEKHKKTPKKKKEKKEKEFDYVNFPATGPDEDSDSIHYHLPVRACYSVGYTYQTSTFISLGINVGGPSKAQWQYFKKLKKENKAGEINYIWPMKVSVSWSYPSLSPDAFPHTSFGVGYQIFPTRWLGLGADFQMYYNWKIHASFHQGGFGPFSIISDSFDREKYVLIFSTGFYIPLSRVCKLGIKVGAGPEWQTQKDGSSKIWSQSLLYGVEVQF